MSYRNDTNPIYDLTLLADLPDPARAEGQGYNLDLSNQGRNRGAPALPVGPPSSQHGATYGYSPEAVTLARKEEQPENGGRKDFTAKVPWYRTKRGVKAIVIIVILIICVVVGGAVGGTHHSSHSQTNDNGTGSGSNGNKTTTTASNIPQQSAQSTATSASVQAAGPGPGSSSTRTSDAGSTQSAVSPNGPGGGLR